MKKSLLALGAACIALSGMAAAPQKVQSTSVKNIDRSVELKSTSNIRVNRNASALKKTPAKAQEVTDILYEVEGKQQLMNVHASGYYQYLLWILQYVDQDFGGEVVYGENDEIYFKNILPQAATGTFVKGVKNGDKVEVSLPQTVMFDEDYGYGLNLSLMSQYTEVNEETGEEYIGYELADAESVTFTLSEDGSIAAEGISDELILGYSYTDDDSWSGYGVSQLSMTEFNEVPVAPTADYEVSKNFWLFNYGEYCSTVNWAQGYDEVYFQGLYDGMPDAWIKGTVEYEDDHAVISIAQNQFMGVYAGMFIYTKCAKFIYDEYGGLVDAELMPDDYEYKLIWDFEENTLTSNDPDVYFVINAALDRVYYAAYFEEINLVHQDDFSGTPVNPTDLAFYNTMEDYGYDAFYFTIPAVSTDGDFLDTKDLYYVVYVDGEEWECDATDYEIPESLVEIPWDYSASYIYKYAGAYREVDLFVEGISTVGVQSIYKYNGEETRSDIVTLDLTVAVDGINADKKIASVKMYDVAGREVSKDAKGVVIKRVVYEDGTVASFKNMAR